MATIYDVAREAGVSATTVSHVINGTRRVLPATEANVRAAMAALDYRPNSLARGLRTQRSQIIGFIVPDIANPFYAELARGLERRCYAAGYILVLFSTDYDVAREADYVRALADRQAEGLIVAPAKIESPALALAKRMGLPTVELDNEGEGASDGVYVDNEAAGAMAARHLLDLGHRAIGCIAYHAGLTSTSDRRLTGFRAALAEAGVELADAAVARGDFRLQAGEAAMGALMRRNPGLTAVFACNDLMAAGALLALRRAGLRAPDDISVIGVDNSLQSLITAPPLTTIDQHTDALAAAALTMLLERIADPGRASRRRVLGVALVERESCGRLEQPERSVDMVLEGEPHGR